MTKRPLCTYMTDEAEATQLIKGMRLPPLVAPKREVRDALGEEVAPYLQQAFSGRVELLRIIKEITKQSEAVAHESMLRHGRYIDIEKVQQLLATACGLIGSATPFMPCDCSSSAEECPKCKGDLWLPASNSRETLLLEQKQRSRAR